MLSQDAAKRFSAFTGANIGKPLAIVLDGKVLSAPRINGQISDNGVITTSAISRKPPISR